jgi:hypothetical protein
MGDRTVIDAAQVDFSRGKRLHYEVREVADTSLALVTVDVYGIPSPFQSRIMR